MVDWGVGVIERVYPESECLLLVELVRVEVAVYLADRVHVGWPMN